MKPGVMNSFPSHTEPWEAFNAVGNPFIIFLLFCLLLLASLTQFWYGCSILLWYTMVWERGNTLYRWISYMCL